MCGRYVTVTKIKEIEKRFGVESKEPEKYRPHVNVGPGAIAPVVANDDPQELQFFKFGLTPFWAKKQMYVFNARAEGDHNKDNDPRYNGAKGIIEKPMFRTSIRKKRCLVVADAFIEGPEKEKLSKPYLVYMKDGQRPFAFAGIWDEWTDKSSGEIIRSFAIITAPANSVCAALGHHRSPVILHREHEQTWLDSALPLADVVSLLQPYPGDEMNAYPISDRIKSPRAAGLDLLEPTGERISPEYNYEFYSEINLEGMGQSRARKRKNGEQQSLFD